MRTCPHRSFYDCLTLHGTKHAFLKWLNKNKRILSDQLLIVSVQPALGHILHPTRVGQRNYQLSCWLWYVLHAQHICHQKSQPMLGESLKVLVRSVGLCETIKINRELYVSFLVYAWRIICENFNPIQVILSSI